MADELEFYTDTFGEHRWRVLAENHELVLASTEGYVRKDDAIANARRFLVLRAPTRDGRYPVVPAGEVHASCRAREEDAARVRRAARALVEVVERTDPPCGTPDCEMPQCRAVQQLEVALNGGRQ